MSGMSWRRSPTHPLKRPVSFPAKVAKNFKLSITCVDWIIGSPDLTIASQDDFYNLMIHNTNKPVRLIVYNIDTDCCREAIVTPSFEWGGEGW